MSQLEEHRRRAAALAAMLALLCSALRQAQFNTFARHSPS